MGAIAVRRNLIGEISYGRPGDPVPDSNLLLKLLLTSQPLSIQVHPDDARARAMGQRNGKTEAWYVVDAQPTAKVAVGFHGAVSRTQLRRAVDNGSISELIAWRPVKRNDIIFVPAGTIHAIGAGLVIAEIQQRSETTFRLFDHGRSRPLQIDDAIAVASIVPAHTQPQPTKLTDQRTQLVACPHFVFERILLAPGTTWRMEVEQETWLLLLAGSADCRSFGLSRGDAMYAASDRVDIQVGNDGLTALVAYHAARSVPHLLQRLANRASASVRQQNMLSSLGTRKVDLGANGDTVRNLVERNQ